MTNPDCTTWIEQVFTEEGPDIGAIWEVQQEIPHWPVECVTTFFNDAKNLAGRFSPEALHYGLWHLQMNCELKEVLWNRSVAWEPREACWKSMEVLFRDFFAHADMEQTTFMWWDSFRDFSDDPDPQVVATVFGVLKQILALPSELCQAAALHGLGHLEHPDKREAIIVFLAQPGLSGNIRDYAQHVLEGPVL